MNHFALWRVLNSHCDPLVRACVVVTVTKMALGRHWDLDGQHPFYLNSSRSRKMCSPGSTCLCLSHGVSVAHCHPCFCPFGFHCCSDLGETPAHKEHGVSIPSCSHRHQLLMLLSSRRHSADLCSYRQAFHLLAHTISFGPRPHSSTPHVRSFPSYPETIAKAWNLVKGQGPIYQTPHGAFYKLGKAGWHQLTGVSGRECCT